MCTTCIHCINKFSNQDSHISHTTKVVSSGWLMRPRRTFPTLAQLVFRVTVWVSGQTSWPVCFGESVLMNSYSDFMIESFQTQRCSSVKSSAACMQKARSAPTRWRLFLTLNKEPVQMVFNCMAVSTGLLLDKKIIHCSYKSEVIFS